MQNLDYLPFGELNSSNSWNTDHFFTGDERDSETNLDHTWFRQYSSQLGRWMHPDPAGLAAADITNPQSWNRYAYVWNNPLALTDPLGLDWQCFDVTVGGQTRTQCKWVPDPGNNGGANPNCAPVTLDGGSLGSTCDTPCNEFMLNPRPCSRTDEENIRGNTSGGSWLRNIARKVGNYIPLVCSGGVYNSAGVTTGTPVSVGVSPHFQQADFGLSQGKLYSAYSEGVFGELSGGEFIQGGVGQALTHGYGQSFGSSSTKETFLFGGVGGSTPYAGGNVSAFYATKSSFGIALSGNLLAFQGSVGAYVNVTSATSCFGF